MNGMHRFFGFKGLRPIPVRVGHDVARYAWVKAPAGSYAVRRPLPAREQLKPR